MDARVEPKPLSLIRVWRRQSSGPVTKLSRHREGRGRNPVRASRKSDRLIVPGKPPNKATLRVRAMPMPAPHWGTKAETPETDKGRAKRMATIRSRAAEAVEGRGLTKGNTAERNTRRTQCRGSVPNELDRVRGTTREAGIGQFGWSIPPGMAVTPSAMVGGSRRPQDLGKPSIFHDGSAKHFRVNTQGRSPVG